MACEAVHSQNGSQVDIARSWRDHGTHVAVSVENVENVFVPQGHYVAPRSTDSDLSGNGAIPDRNRVGMEGALGMWFSTWFPV